jgi:uncharacterized protein
MKPESVSLTNRAGHRIDCTLSESGDKEWIVVFAHGLSSSQKTRSITEVSAQLHNAGISTLTFDFHGHGQSEGAFADLTLTLAIDDLTRAVAYARSLGYRKVGLFGESFGGAAAICVAAVVQPDFVVLRSPVCHYEEKEHATNAHLLDSWKENGFIERQRSDGAMLRLNYTFFEDLKHHDGYKAAEGIACPVFITHGDVDERVPIEQSRKMATILPDCELLVVEGANHRYTDPEHFSQSIVAIVRFMLGQMR